MEPKYYGVVSDRDIEKLIKTVNYLRDRGGMLAGSLAIDGWDSGTCFYQAMLLPQQDYYEVDNLHIKL